MRLSANLARLNSSTSAPSPLLAVIYFVTIPAAASVQGRMTLLTSSTTSTLLHQGARVGPCGNYGECSPDVHELLAITADGLAERRWRLMGARSMTEARAFFIARLRPMLHLVSTPNPRCGQPDVLQVQVSLTSSYLSKRLLSMWGLVITFSLV